DPPIISQVLSKAGREPPMNLVGGLVIREDLPSPNTEVIEQLLEQVEARDQILVLLLQLMDQVESATQHLVDADRGDPKIGVGRRGQPARDHGPDRVVLLEVAQGVRVQEVHSAGSSSGIRSRRRAFRILRYSSKRASSWNEGTLIRQGSGT